MTKNHDHDDDESAGPRTMLDAHLEQEFFAAREIFMDLEFGETTVNKLAGRILYLTRIADALIGERRKDSDALYTAEDFHATLHINSYGGSVYEFLRLYDLIHAAPFKVDTVVHGKAMSAGAMLAMVGTGKRYCYPTSTYMVHSISSIAIGSFDDLVNELEETKRLQNLLKKICVAHTGLDKKKVDEVFRQDSFLNAKLAKKFGLVDEIIKSKHTPTVKPKKFKVKKSEEMK